MHPASFSSTAAQSFFSTTQSKDPQLLSNHAQLFPRWYGEVPTLISACPTPAHSLRQIPPPPRSVLCPPQNGLISPLLCLCLISFDILPSYHCYLYVYNGSEMLSKSNVVSFILLRDVPGIHLGTTGRVEFLVKFFYRDELPRQINGLLSLASSSGQGG